MKKSSIRASNSLIDRWERREGYAAYAVNAVLIAAKAPLSSEAIQRAVSAEFPEYKGLSGHLQELRMQGLVEPRDNHWSVTEHGRRVWAGLEVCPPRSRSGK
jgi:hypothetical protein